MIQGQTLVLLFTRDGRQIPTHAPHDAATARAHLEGTGMVDGVSVVTLKVLDVSPADSFLDEDRKTDPHPFAAIERVPV